MGPGIGRVGKLLEQQVAGVVFGELFRSPDGARHAFAAGSQHQLGPENPEEFAPLQAHRLGHHQGQLVAALGADESQPDPGIPAGGFQENGVRADGAFDLGGLDHAQGDPVFDAGQRVEKFQFEGHPGRQTRRHSAELDQRSAADELGDVVGDAGHETPLTAAGAAPAPLPFFIMFRLPKSIEPIGYNSIFKCQG